MQLPIVAQSPIFAQPWEAGAGTPDIVRIAEACDRAGFFYLAVSDHICIPRERALAMSIVWYDPVATLGFLAAATRQVRLLSYVYVLPYRHPLATAKAFATLDALSGGRVILGVGAGHLEAEFRTLRGDEPIEIGANSPWLYVGTPSFDLGPNARSGPGEVLAGILLDLKALGVNHVGVRFRTRSVDELLDQIDAFAHEVAPHL